jgi:hypothetical protein
MKLLHALLFITALSATSAFGQHQSYSAQHTRDIKALSAEEVNQYRAGAGMGYARAAELNRYPGPMHVLELAGPLALTPDQRAAAQKLMQTHKAEARAIGDKLVDAEHVLDRLFAQAAASEGALAQQVRAVATLRGEYRLSHLETHRRMRALLSDEQVHRYVQLRGYGSGSSATGTHANPHQH